jgi:hypothetical protein
MDRNKLRIDNRDTLIYLQRFRLAFENFCYFAINYFQDVT